MSIRRQRLNDEVAVLYDLGSAHGKHVSNTIEEFVSLLNVVRDDYDLVTFTNSGQVKEREYLAQLGFKASSPIINGRMMFHQITAAELDKNIGPLLERSNRVKECREKAEQFFRDKREKETADGRDLQVGDLVCYVAGYSPAQIKMYEFVQNTSAYGIVEIKENTDWPIVISMWNWATMKPGATAISGEYLGGYKKAHFVRPLATKDELNAKIKEYTDEIK